MLARFNQETNVLFFHRFSESGQENEKPLEATSHFDALVQVLIPIRHYRRENLNLVYIANAEEIPPRIPPGMWCRLGVLPQFKGTAC